MTDLEVEERFKVLGQELRCLVCQNQTLADSNADLARDLRTEVEAQIRQGKTDRQIKDYLLARYGDFVLYRPEVKSSTYLLWGGPFALLGVGGLAWVLSRRRKAASESQNQFESENQRTDENQRSIESQSSGKTQSAGVPNKHPTLTTSQAKSLLGGD